MWVELDVKVPYFCSWSWRKLLKLSIMGSHSYYFFLWQTKLSFQDCTNTVENTTYGRLMHETTSTSYCSSTYHISLPIVLWDKFVWFGHNIPRMAFILWLAITDWFTTKDRIRKYAPCTEARCVFWLGTVETIEHISVY